MQYKRGASSANDKVQYKQGASSENDKVQYKQGASSENNIKTASNSHFSTKLEDIKTVSIGQQNLKTLKQYLSVNKT